MITITDKEFHQIAAYIKMNYGINLKAEKQMLVTGRLQNVLIENGITNFTDYYKYIQSDKTGKAVKTLVERITTNHTFFMREADHFYYFRDFVLPYLSRTVREKDLRIWSAGCSSGEEPYTLAMLIDDFLGNEKKLWDAQILATDISSKVLSKAMRGVYPHEAIANLPSNWKLQHFHKVEGDQYTLNDKIKKEVVFRIFNLMDETFPFRKKFHVIFCRNVMIYFDEKTKMELVNKFYDHMEPGGFLFIGHSESLVRGETKFRYVMPAVYRKL